MSTFNARRPALSGHKAGILVSALLATALASGAGLTAASAADTDIKFSLDFKFEGPSAPFLVPIDKGYYKAEGLNVTVDTASGSLGPINRVASGTYDMGCG
ncbi:MAG: ABC transporter substrate-binding protein, partial [Hyphomicrobiales bacterium]|nr:ABC transporter substrate-binding protein [Hyphomicrobiales bacterium]